VEALFPSATTRATTCNQYLHEPHISLAELLSTKQLPKVVSQPLIDGSVYFEPLLAMHTRLASKTSAGIPTPSTCREDLVACRTCWQHLPRTNTRLLLPQHVSFMRDSTHQIHALQPGTKLISNWVTNFERPTRTSRFQASFVHWV